jgi:predicted nucleic acid-binding protein
VKLLIDERGTPAMREVLATTTELISSRLAYVEAHSAMARARAGRRLSGAEYDRLQAAFERLWGRMAVVAVDESLVDRAASLARAHVLRGYDAVHLAAAVAAAGGTSIGFACFDDDLRAAAVREGLAPFPDES